MTATVTVPTSSVSKVLTRLLTRRGKPESRTCTAPTCTAPVAPGPSRPDVWLAGLRLGS